MEEATRNGVLGTSIPQALGDDVGGRTDLLLRFFDSSFFNEWIALTYLWKSKSAGVHDYLCNRLYALPPERLEPYLVELVRLATMWPGSSLERCIVDLCGRSLRVALKIRWLLVASAESVPPNPHVVTVINACTEAATKAKWPAPFRNLSVPPNLIEHISVSYDTDRLDTDSNGCYGSVGVGTEEGGAGTQIGDCNSSEEDPEANSVDREESLKERSIFHRLWWSSSSPDLRSSFEKPEAGEDCDEGPSDEQKCSVEFVAREAERDLAMARYGSPASAADDGAACDDNNGWQDNRARTTSSGSAVSATRDRSASCLMRQDTFRATVDFIFALCETSSELAAIADRKWRETVLQAAIEQLNEELSITEITTGPAYPMGKIARVIRIVEDEAILLNSRDRAPLLLYMEVLEVPSEPDAATVVPRDSALKPNLEPHHVHHSRHYSWSPSVNTLNKVHGGVASRPIDIGGIGAPEEGNINEAHVCRRTVSDFTEAMNEIDWKAEQLELEGSADTPIANGMDFSSYPNSPDGGVTGVLGCALDIDHMTKRIDESVARLQNGFTQGGAAGPPNRVQVKLNVKKAEGSRFQLFGSPDVKVEVQLKVLGHQRVPSHEALLNMARRHRKPVPDAPQGRPLSPPRVVRTGGLERSLSPWREQAAAEAAVRAQARAVIGEKFEQKKERIQRGSTYGTMENWNLRAIIVKSGDDCRQELLATQLINHFQAIFKESNLPLWLKSYEILVISAKSALIEVIPDALSIDTIKKRFPGRTLNEYFCHKYVRGSEEYRAAQKKFVESLAAYSIVTYLLQIKDRHNGNLLLDDEGHIIHIDFGFMLSNSPGGMNFETAPFKLTRELLEVMGSDADGVGSEPFDYFKVLVVQGFLAVRKHADRIILLIEMMQGMGCPCFRGGQRVLQGLKRRYMLASTEERTIEHVLGLIGESLDNWRTRQYDYYQRVLNGIL